MAGVRRKVKSSVELPQLVRQTSRIAFVVATVGCFGLPSQALALQQEGGAEVEKVEQGERHIVVTATKRDQTLEEVPIAVTVVGQEELISKGIEDITNLERAAPSYAVSTSDSATGGLVLRLRGVGTTGNNIGLESSVGAFIDGFYLPRPGAALSDLYDVQQIELLKGPQGTLFGRNTSAGAMVIKTNPPRTDIVEGFVNATIGNYDLYGVQAGFNVPLVQDKIGLRIAGAYRNRGGYITNVVGDESQTRDRISIRGQLLFDLEDAGELRLLAGYNRGKDDCCMAIWTQRSPFIEANSAPFSAFAPTAGAPNVGADAVDPYLANDNTNFVNPFHGWSIAAHYDVSLPFGELSYLGYYGDSFADSCRGDYTALNVYAVGDCPEIRALNPGIDLDPLNGTSIKSTSHELRLQGESFDGALDWIIGAYYSHEKIDQKYTLFFLDQMQEAVSVGAFGQPVFNELNFAAGGANSVLDYAAPRAQQKGESFSIFTHNVIELSDRLSLIVGARYVDESKNAKLSEQVPGQHNACFGTFNSLAGYLAPGGAYHPTDGFFGAGGPGRLAAAVQTNCWIFTSPFFDPSDPNSFFQQFVGDPVTSPFLQFIPQPFDQKFGDDRLTYTLNVRYEVADRTFLYGGYSQGFKSGGFNLDVSSASGGADPTFRSEKVDAFELGLKSRFLGGRAWANIALFHTNLKDFQVLEFDGTRFNTFNTDKALSTGVEIESGFDLSDAVTLNLAGSYTDARYPSDCASFDPTDPNFTPAATSLCGTRLTNAPELVLIGGLDFNTEIGNAGMSVFGGATVRYESKRRTGTRPTELPATAGALTEDDVRAAVAAALPLPQDIQPGNTKVDLRFGFGAADGQFTIEAWARNVFDTRTRFVTFNIPLRGFGGSRARGAFVQEPRTYGVTARAKF